MKDHVSANLTLPRTPAVRGDRAPFSPPAERDRAALDAFCAQARPWALRQAARAYRHLPAEMRSRAVDSALGELRAGAPAGSDRRALQGELGELLTQALRRSHVGWCLSRSPALTQEQATSGSAPPASPSPSALTGFIEEGLGGLERAVMQLEIGAGRDSRTVRAALRLGPRQYARHREEGLAKLRAAILGQVANHVCDDHAGAVVLAATGDRDAAGRLASGPTRCRACSREAQALQRLLHERLAVAPWPLTIKPMGLLATKLAALGALGAKGGAGAAAGSAPLSGGTTAVASVLAAAAVATGTYAVVDHAGTDRAPAAASPAVQTVTAPVAQKRTALAAPAAARPAAKRAAKAQHKGAARHAAAPSAATAPAAAPPAAGPTAASAPKTSAEHLTQAVSESVGGLGKTVQQTTGRLLPPSLSEPVQGTVGAVTDTVGKTVQGVTGAVGRTVDGAVKTVDGATGGSVGKTVDGVTGAVGGLLGR